MEVAKQILSLPGLPFHSLTVMDIIGKSCYESTWSSLLEIIIGMLQDMITVILFILLFQVIYTHLYPSMKPVISEFIIPFNLFPNIYLVYLFVEHFNAVNFKSKLNLILSSYFSLKLLLFHTFMPHFGSLFFLLQYVYNFFFPHLKLLLLF